MGKKFFILISFLYFTSAQAIDVDGITLNGEVAFDYNLLSNGDNDIPFTGSAANEAYRLNQTQILLKKEAEKISFLTRFVYMPTSYVTETSPATTSRSNLGTLDQIEIYYKVTPNLYVGFGRFLTTMGFESLLKYENANYGNTIAYQAIVPGYGEGLRVKYVAGDSLALTASTYNQATYSAFGDDYTPTKTTEVSATSVIGNFSVYGGYYFGKDLENGISTSKKTASSVWTSYKFMESFLIAFTYDSRTAQVDSGALDWSDSSGALLTYSLGMNHLAFRYEIVRGAKNLIENGAFPYSSDAVNSVTLTDKIAINENLKIYLEYRSDIGSEKVFKNRDGVANSDSHAEIYTLGAVAKYIVVLARQFFLKVFEIFRGVGAFAS